MGDTKRLVSNTAIIFVGSSIASVFSYLFNMLMGRLLGPAQYGEMAAILSLLSILSVISGVITTITMLYVSELYGLGNLAGIKRLLKLLSRYVFFLAILFFLVGTALARPIASFFSISHIVPVVIAFSSFIFGFIIASEISLILLFLFLIFKRRKRRKEEEKENQIPPPNKQLA